MSREREHVNRKYWHDQQVQWRDDYIYNDLTIRQISKKYGVGTTTIWRALDDFGVPMREQRDYMDEHSKYSGMVDAQVRQYLLDNYLSGRMNVTSISKDLGVSRSTVYYLLRKFTIPLQHTNKSNNSGGTEFGSVAYGANKYGHGGKYDIYTDPNIPKERTNLDIDHMTSEQEQTWRYIRDDLVYDGSSREQLIHEYGVSIADYDYMYNEWVKRGELNYD